MKAVVQKKSPIRVAIYQPVIPEYRIPLFTQLHRSPELNIKVFASMSAPQAPPTPKKRFEFPFQPIKFNALLGNRIIWQSGCCIPQDFEPGDVLVLSGNPRYISNHLLILHARRFGFGVVWWGIWHHPNSNWLSKKIRKQLLRLADVVLVYADREVEELVAEGLSPSRVFAINNTISTERIEIEKLLWTRERLNQFLARRGLKDKDYILYCGRLTPKPKIHYAIKALSILKRSGHTLFFVVIGDGPEKPSLIRYARELNVDNQIRWLGPIYDEGALAPWFLNATVLVYPGSIGLSIFHAFAYGLPVLTHNDSFAQPPEFFALRDGINGLTFRKDAPEDLAQKIYAVFSDRDNRAYMSENALRTVREKYSFYEMVDRFVKAIRTASEIALNKQ